MTYEVQLYDQQTHTVNCYIVHTADSYAEAANLIQEEYPNQKLLAVVKKP
jgi:hypothetical protein